MRAKAPAGRLLVMGRYHSIPYAEYTLCLEYEGESGIGSQGTSVKEPVWISIVGVGMTSTSTTHYCYNV